MDDPIAQYATPRQREYLEAVNRCGSQAKAADDLGVHRRTLERALQALKSKAAKKGYAPDKGMVHTVPDGFHVKGVSTLYKDGEQVVQWVKSGADKAQRTIEALQESIAEIIEDARGKHTVIAPPSLCDSDLLCAYPIADAHIGLYAWAEESGKNHDTDTMIKLLTSTMAQMVDQAPKAETALIIDLGDYFHTDTSQNRTLASGHVLDVDTRWKRVYQLAVIGFRRLITMALSKHKKVVVKTAVGNHDEHSSFSKAMLMEAFFESDPRVDVHLPYDPFDYYHFGRCLLGINHGEIKPERLPLIMAADRAEEWGESEHRHWFTGHIHHKTVHEFNGCMVESLRSPTARDAWTHKSGYRSGRDLQQITFHRERGEVARQRIAIL